MRLPRPRGSANLLTLLTVGLALTTVLLFFFAIYTTYRATVTQHLETARLVAATVEDGLTRTLESVETVLLGIAQDTCAGDCQIPPPDLDQQLQRALRFSPHIRQIAITTAQGQVLADSAERSEGHTIDFRTLGLPCLAGAGANDKDRRLPLNGMLNQGLMVGRETPGRYLPTQEAEPDPPSPRSILPVVLCLPPTHVIIAALNPTHLRKALTAEALGPSSRIWLSSLDGHPVLGDDPAHPLSSFPTMALRPPVEAGAIRGVLPLAAPARAHRGRVAFHLSQRYSVAVMATTTRGDAFSTWLDAEGTMVFWDVVALLTLLVVGGVLTREALYRSRLESRVRLLALTQDVFANASEAMLITDPKGRILSVNPTFTALTGHAEPALHDRLAHRFLVPATEKGDETEPADRPDSRLWTLRCRDGSERAVEVRKAPLGEDTDVLTLYDVTLRLETQRALVDALDKEKRASQAKTEFLANMSHELRTPLNAIIGFSDIMKAQMIAPLPPAYAEYADLINSSGRHLLEMINQILDLAKIEAGKLTLDRESLYPTALLRDVVSILSHQAQSRGLVLVEHCTCPHTLSLDPVRVRQVFINIVGNAIKYTKHGEVVIESVCDPQGHHFRIRDTGKGMTAEEVAQSLKPFERVHGGAFTRGEQGTGLGLPLATRIMDLHGGQLEISSTPGQGTTVVLTFPRDPGESGTPDPTPPPVG